MQIILVSQHMSQAKTLVIMPRHLAIVAAVFAAAVILMSTFISWVSIQWRLPMAEDLAVSVIRAESEKERSSLTQNLEAMADRLGDLQNQLLQLDRLGGHMAGLLGLKRERSKDALPEGGPYVPSYFSTPDALREEIEKVASYVEQKTAQLGRLEEEIEQRKTALRQMPILMPVEDARLGSGFGRRADPFSGSPAMHEGIDFAGDIGTPVLATGDGRISFAGWHPEYGNMVDVDHANGLSSRYAHLSRVDVKVGQSVHGGDMVGALGSTGRSTGPHLHYEVRRNGVAQNPVRYLRQGEKFAQLAAR